MAKKISLGTPDPLAQLAASAGAGPGDGGGGPPASPGGPDMGAGENIGAADGGAPMSYPELHTGDLPPESGIADLPDEGQAHVKYKVTDRGKHTHKHGPLKGKETHSATMEIHHIMPLSGGGGDKETEPDKVRKSAKDFFAKDDAATKASKAPKPTESDAESEMPG